MHNYIFNVSFNWQSYKPFAFRKRLFESQIQLCLNTRDTFLEHHRAIKRNIGGKNKRLELHAQICKTSINDGEFNTLNFVELDLLGITAFHRETLT